MSNGIVLSGARFKIGSTLITAADIISIGLSKSFATATTTGLGEANNVYLTTVGDADITLNGFYTSGSVGATNSLRAAVVAVEAQADRSDTFAYYPSGITSGNHMYTGTLVLTGISEEASNDAFAPYNATFKVSGAITSGSSSGS